MSQLEQLQDAIRQKLPELDMVIAWGTGFDPLHATPLFIREQGDLDKMTWGPLCVHNLATYLPGLKGKKVGVVVKGCDSRSIVQLLEESLIERENLTVFGLPCDGIVDLAKVEEALGPEAGFVREVREEGDALVVQTDSGDHRLSIAELRPQKCLSCRYPNPVLADQVLGETREPVKDPTDPDLEALETMSYEERMQYWTAQLDRCIRCYACRNACPMCVCRDHCIAQTRDPQWISQETGVAEKWLFQIIHAQHLAGRCTECGECERACPMDIPILTLKRKMNREIKEMFDFEAGTDPEATPPLFTFQVEEAKINERGW